MLTLHVPITLLLLSRVDKSISFSKSPCREERTRIPRPAKPLTDWVVENLEEEESSITSSSSTQAGEGDTLPIGGLEIGDFRVLAADQDWSDSQDEKTLIRLLVGRNGWGTGVHPTTRMCMEWLREEFTAGASVIDYGVGSGILSIAALHQGASKVIGVDVEAEALVAAERNVALNGYEGRFEGLHTREVLPYGILPGGADVCVANILIGQLVRPSMVAALTTNLASGGLLCLSGIRPSEVASLRQAYDQDIDWIEEDYGELSAAQTVGSIESYGFDVGTWARLVGRKRISDRRDDLDRMSESALL